MVDGGLCPQHAAYRRERLVVPLHRVPLHAMLDAHSFFAPFQIATHFPTKRLRHFTVQPHRPTQKAPHNSAHIPTLPRSFPVPRSPALPLPCSLLPRPDTSSAASEPRPLLDTLASIARSPAAHACQIPSAAPGWPTGSPSSLPDS